MSSLIVDQALIDINESEDKDGDYKLDVTKFIDNRRIDDLLFIKVKKQDRNINTNKLNRIERNNRNHFIRQLEESKSRLSIRNEYAAIYVKQQKLKQSRFKTKQTESDTDASGGDYDLNTSLQTLKTKNSSFHSPSDLLNDISVPKFIPISSVEKWSSRIHKSTGNLTDTQVSNNKKLSDFKPKNKPLKNFSSNLSTTVERENTKDSVLAGYDKLVDSFRDTITTPHAYTQINDESISNGTSKIDESLRSEMQTPNEYVTINPTRSISLYSKLTNGPKQVVKQEAAKIRRNVISLNTSITELVETPRGGFSNNEIDNDTNQTVQQQQQQDELQNKENISITNSKPIIKTGPKKFLSFTNTKKPLLESTPKIDADTYNFNGDGPIIKPTKQAAVISKKINKFEIKSKIQATNSSFTPRKSNLKKKFNEPPDKKPKFDPNNCEMKEFKHCIITDLKIGEGEFGETFQGYRYDLGSPVKIAAKRLKNLKFKTGANDTTNENVLAEVCVLSQLGTHDNVIGYLGIHNLDDTTYMVFEYAEKGDLKRILDNSRKSSKPELSVNAQWKIKFAYEIASGMQYISEMGIVHKDLAARNVLLNKDYTCKIADFGCCKSDFLTRRPIRWMSPESINKHLFTTASDVWAFGIVSTTINSCK